MSELTRLFQLILEDFDPNTRALIVTGLFNPRYFDVDEFAEKYRVYKMQKPIRTRAKRGGWTNAKK